MEPLKVPFTRTVELFHGDEICNDRHRGMAAMEYRSLHLREQVVELTIQSGWQIPSEGSRS